MGLPLVGEAEEVLSVKTKTGEFLVFGMTGHEHLGQMFEYTIELAGGLDFFNEPKEVDLHDLAGTEATVKMKAKTDERFFHGYVTRLNRGEKRGRYELFTMTLRPWLWFLTRTKTSRVFQGKSVKDIITKVFDDYSGVSSSWKTTATYPPLDYCVQHDETDFDFVSRLMEEVGIYYYFEHKDGSHKLVLIDAMGAHDSRGDTSAIKWATKFGGDATVTNWHVQEEARAVKAVVTDYDYLAPKTEIKGSADFTDSPQKTGKMEWFEHPGRVVQNGIKPDTTDASTAVTNRAEVVMQELVTLYYSVSGRHNARDLAAGLTFKVSDAPNDDDNDEYLLVSALYTIDFAPPEALKDPNDKTRHEGFSCDFIAMRTKAPNQFRSRRITPRPVIAGPQTALVVGDSGSEILTDKHGRIKIKFYWDRDPKKDQDSSCWVRVAQPWAGKRYGAFALPRVGNEVVVHFLDGNPDRPLVTGSVYNGENMPAWKLPDHSSVSGVKTQSTKKGTPELANELRFDDMKGSEYIWFHAEKDFHRVVQHDAFDWVGNNESVKVVLTRKEVIGENWFMDITKDVMHNMGKDLHVKVAGDIFFTGGATYQLQLEKDYSAKVGGDVGLEVVGKTQLKSTGDIVLQSSSGKLSLKAGSSGDLMAEGMTIKIKGATTVAIEGGVSVSLKAGPSFVNVGPSGVDISGPMVKVNSGGSAGSAGSALAASPTAPTEAKKEDSITTEKKADYNKTFDDPIPIDAGGTGPAKEG